MCVHNRIKLRTRVYKTMIQCVLYWIVSKIQSRVLSICYKPGAALVVVVNKDEKNISWKVEPCTIMIIQIQKLFFTDNSGKQKIHVYHKKSIFNMCGCMGQSNKNYYNKTNIYKFVQYIKMVFKTNETLFLCFFERSFSCTVK